MGKKQIIDIIENYNDDELIYLTREIDDIEIQKLRKYPHTYTEDQKYTMAKCIFNNKIIC